MVGNGTVWNGVVSGGVNRAMHAVMKGKSMRYACVAATCLFIN